MICGHALAEGCRSAPSGRAMGGWLVSGPHPGAGSAVPTSLSSMPEGVPSVPDHELLRRIGRGAYGEVWLARNSMGCYRAVKVVFRDEPTQEEHYAREMSGIKRFEPLSRRHEGFVDLLQVGFSPDGRYFYCVMELAD